MPRIPWEQCKEFASKESDGANLSDERIETISCLGRKDAGAVIQVSKGDGLGVQAIFSDDDQREFVVVVLEALPDQLRRRALKQGVWRRGHQVKSKIPSPPKSHDVPEQTKPKVAQVSKPPRPQVPKATIKEPKDKLDYLMEFPGCIIGFPVALVLMGAMWMLNPFIMLFALITRGASALRGRDDGPPDDFGNPGGMGE